MEGSNRQFKRNGGQQLGKRLSSLVCLVFSLILIRFLWTNLNQLEFLPKIHCSPPPFDRNILSYAYELFRFIIIIFCWCLHRLKKIPFQPKCICQFKEILYVMSHDIAVWWLSSKKIFPSGAFMRRIHWVRENEYFLGLLRYRHFHMSKYCDDIFKAEWREES